MDAGDSHVVQVPHVVAHGLRRDNRFFGDRNVAGAGGNHDDLSLAVESLVLRERDGARELVECSLAKLALHGTKLLRRNPSRQDVVPVLGKPGEDGGKLLRSFSRPKDDFGHAHAQRAMMIHVGEAQVLERKMPQLLHCFVGRELASLYFGEQFLEGIGSHKSVVRD